ncbi:MAG: response regulator [Nitrospirae bacterium]|nr:response regulator [Nitrospirota bacterium]
MNRTVLFVDDEPNVLNAVKRLFQDEDISVVTAESGEAALELIKTREIGVIVSDNMMPHMNGIEFLERSKSTAPESVRILMTGYADMQAAIEAINRGEVYRFLTKPWRDRDLVDTVSAAVDRYNVVTALKTADEATLLSLAQTIELKDPYTRGHCDRVAHYALSTAERLGLTGEDKKHIRQGSWLHDCGKIGVPEAILNFNGPLSAEQMDVMKNHSRWGAEVARLAKLPDPVVSIILNHHEKYDGSGYPQGLKGGDIPYLARIVAVADFYDALASDRPYRKAMAREKAFEILIGSRSTCVDPDILDVFVECVRGM